MYIPLQDKAYLYLILIHRVLLHLNCVGPQVLLAEIKEKGLKDTKFKWVGILSTTFYKTHDTYLWNQFGTKQTD